MTHVALKPSDEIAAALNSDRPIVALESTLISHGLPWPANLETANDAEFAVREAGAVPATIAVIDGVVRIGLGRDELERLARGDGVLKASARELPWLVAMRRTAATTVAGTIFVAHRVGIPLMATGGIGGVHRDANDTWDVSADLIQLSRTPVAVVSSGAKAILDLGRTLEILETHGVLVVGYRTDELPAFFSVSSGLRLDCRVDDSFAAAEVLRRVESLISPAGILFVNPPPAASALPRDELDSSVRQAIDAATSAGVRGKALTPFLLEHIRESTAGRSLAVNRALVIENARLAGEIAVALKSAE